MSKWDNAVCCMGDSLTENDGWGVPAHLMYPGVLQTTLNSNGANCVVRNFGRSGNTTTQMVSRFARMTQFGVPKIGIIYGGANDGALGSATTQSNIENMIQQLKTAGCNNVLVISMQYLNWSTGGDTLATPYSSYVPFRTAQQQACTNKGAIYVDWYNYLRNRIVNGQDTQGSFSWHVADQNIHFNTYGEGLLADCVYQAIKAQGWDTKLK